MSKPTTILYLDPEPNNLLAFSAWFRRRAEFDCHTCSKAEEAKAILERYPVQILIADQPTPESIDLGSWVRIPAGSHPPVQIVLTAYRELSLLEKAVSEGLISAYFSKPLDFEELERFIDKVVSDQWSVASKETKDKE